jgi:transcriptional regulator
MYTPKHHEETRLDVLHALMRAHALGTWIFQHDGELKLVKPSL